MRVCLNPAFLLDRARRLAIQFEQNRSLFQQNLEQVQGNLMLMEKERQEFITYALRTKMGDDEFGAKIAVPYKPAPDHPWRKFDLSNHKNKPRP